MGKCPTCGQSTSRNEEGMIEAKIATRPMAGPAQARHIAALRAQLQQAQEELDRKERINRGLRRLIEFCEKESDAACRVGADMMKGLEAERDAAIAAGYRAAEEQGEIAAKLRERAERAERTLARAQRIIASLHTERARLIQRIAALAPAEAQRGEDEWLSQCCGAPPHMATPDIAEDNQAGICAKCREHTGFERGESDA